MSCTICFERFKGSENNLYSTTCGHIYHFVCMQQWKSRSTSCPQCRAYNPKTHKIYLELNDEEPNTSQLEDQLQECRSKITQLELELKRANNRFPNKGNTIKCQMLEETLEGTLEYNKTLEKKLKEAGIKISNLEKQISGMSTNLNKITADKNNLELKYKDLEIEHSRIKNLIETPPNTRITSYIWRMIRNCSLAIVGAQVNPRSNLTNFVLYLGHKMDVHYVRSDIIRTFYNKDDKTIVVQFRTVHQRDEFYENEHQLNYYNETECIEFFDVGDDAFVNTTLFDYALNLKMFNYKSVFRQNKKVMARKDEYEDAIRIYSKEHVDELIDEEASNESYVSHCGLIFSC